MKTKIVVSLMSLALLAACSGGVKEQLGLEKKSPDEFAVVKRAPLSMPPDFALTPPRPGAPRPQEQSPDQAAAQTVFGATPNATSAANADSGESALLARAGAMNADPAIRRKVDAEQAEIAKDNVPVAKKILNFGKADPNDAPVSVVDPEAEKERILKNRAQGKPVTAGQTPSVEQ